MAKRAPVDEQPYRPLLDPSVLSAALTRPVSAVSNSLPAVTTEQANGASSKIIDLPRSHEPKRAEQKAPAPASTVSAPVAPPIKTPTAIHELVEKFDQEKRMLLTRAESAQLDRLVNSLASRLNTQVKSSHVLRALVTLALSAEAEIYKRAGDVSGLTRPANGDANALKKFEREIARVISAAVKDAGPIRAE